MTSKARFYNHWGEAVGDEYDVSTTPRGWVLNGYGRCDFAVGLSDVLLSEQLLRYGNFVHIKHIPAEYTAERLSVGLLPDWTGIINNQTWNKDAVVVSAVSIESVLAYRAMPFVKVEGTPADVFRQIISYANATDAVKNNSPLVTLGQVDDQPATRISSIFGEQQYSTYSDELRTNAYDHIKKMAGVHGMDWDVTAEFSPASGAIRFVANLYNQKGREGLILTTVNSDDQNPLLTVQGPIVNHIYAYNQAQTAETRTVQEITISESISKYGVFQANVIFSGVTDATGVTQRAGAARANTRGEPSLKVGRTALDYLDTFSDIAAGNICFVYDPRVGFNPDGSLGFRSWARILSADYNDLTNKCVLNLELIRRDVAFPDPDSFFV